MAPGRLSERALENAREERISQTTGPTTPERSVISGTAESTGTGQSDTPIKASSHTKHPPTTVAKMKPIVEAELSGSVIDISPAHETVYKSLTHLPITEFLESCPLYVDEIWTKLRDAEGKDLEKYLYDPVEEIIQAILNAFHSTGELWVEKTHRTRLDHIEDGILYVETTPEGDKRDVQLKSSPDLSIMGKGLLFGGSADRPVKPGYNHCLNPIEIKQKKELVMQTVLIQAAIYARQCFIQQPHRRYVPTVVIAGSSLYLHIFDRSGVLRLDKVDIHEDASTFVRIIVGISTAALDLKFCPFDNRVSWDLGDRYPTISIERPSEGVEAEGEADVKFFDVYQVTGTNFSRRAIRGRGTQCWNAEIMIDGNVVTVLIKDSWRSVGRDAEWKLLRKVKGLAGVGQILSYEDDDCTISDFRQHIFDAFYSHEAYTFDRRFSRLILQAYGPSIRRFTTKLQLLEAFYDAVAGHKNLWLKGILHRDVSVDNILLGEKGAETGNRGVIIDFDMAIDVQRTTNLANSQFRTGTRAFQSIAVLNSGVWGNHAPPQDHLDDLESFFYVLGWITIKYDGTNTSRSPEYLNKWEDIDAESCADTKVGYLAKPLLRLSQYFDTPIFRELLASLAGLCDEFFRRKAAIVLKKTDFPLLREVHAISSGGQDHDEFLDLIDKAIKAQEKVFPKEKEHPVSRNAQHPPTPTDVEFAHPPETPRANALTNRAGKRRQTADSVNEEEASGSASKRLKGSEEIPTARPSMRRSTRTRPSKP